MNQKKGICMNCGDYEDIVSDGKCEGCFTSHQEQITQYGECEETAW